MTIPDRRQDRVTAAAITEALRMQTAFGRAAARTLLLRHAGAELAERVLAGRYDPRQGVPRAATRRRP